MEYKYELQIEEPNPHQFKEEMLKNRTFQRLRWKTIALLREKPKLIKKGTRIFNRENGKVYK